MAPNSEGLGHSTTPCTESGMRTLSYWLCFAAPYAGFFLYDLDGFLGGLLFSISWACICFTYIGLHVTLRAAHGSGRGSERKGPKHAPQ